MARARALTVVAAALVALVAGGVVAVALAGRDDDRSGRDRGDRAAAARSWCGPAGAGRRRAPLGSILGSILGGVRDTGEAGYLRTMVAHHREAIRAADALERSDRAEMRDLGARIVPSQSAQVTRMEAWLRRWYPTRAGRPAYRPMMGSLAGLSGDDLDRAFLSRMIRHHMTAVMSSQRLLTGGARLHPPVRRLARTIRDEQRREIATMAGWSRRWFGSGPCAGSSPVGPGTGSRMGPGMMRRPRR